MTRLHLFLGSLALTTCVVLASYYLSYRKLAVPQLNQVAANLYVTSQLTPKNISFLKRRGFKTIVDIRPDGETTDQPPSSEIKQISEAYGLEFHYIPVPHEGIPDDAVNELHEAVSNRTSPTVLYCRTGRRAVRTFALVEASRADGPNADAIIAMVRHAGFAADDLRDKIAQRIASRNHPQTVKSDAH